MNPDTNKFEPLGNLIKPEDTEKLNWPGLIRPNGKPVPKHWTILKVDQKVIVENYTFKVAHIGESYLILEPVGPIIIGEKNKDE